MPNPNPTNFTGFPYGISAPGLGMMAVTQPLALPQTTTKNIWTITGGPIYVDLMMGVVTTTIGAVGNLTKLEYVDAVTSTAADLSSATASDINALAAGALFVLVTSTTTAASRLTAGIGPLASSTLLMATILLPGVIRVNCAGSDGGTGRIQWYMHYVPLGTGISQAGLVQINSPLTWGSLWVWSDWAERKAPSRAAIEKARSEEAEKDGSGKGQGRESKASFEDEAEKQEAREIDFRCGEGA
jgi:hypothetical protein